MTDSEWEKIQRIIPPPKHGGRHRTTDMREVMNAILYVERTDIPWRMLPRDFPPWKTVYHYYRAWRMTGAWKRIEEILSETRRETRHYIE